MDLDHFGGAFWAMSYMLLSAGEGTKESFQCSNGAFVGGQFSCKNNQQKEPTLLVSKTRIGLIRSGVPRGSAVVHVTRIVNCVLFLTTGCPG